MKKDQVDPAPSVPSFSIFPLKRILSGFALPDSKTQS